MWVSSCAHLSRSASQAGFNIAERAGGAYVLALTTTFGGGLQNYGGEVDVVSLDGGQCTVWYTGPAPIGMGVKAAIKDKFPDIKEVVLVDSRP